MQISVVKLFALVSNEAENCHRMKENIRIKTSERGDIKSNRLIEYGNRIVIDEIIKQNERINM